MGQVSGRLNASLTHATFLLVVPVFRPGPEFREFLPKLCATLAKSRFHFRVQVVDDGNEPGVSSDIHRIVASCSVPGVTASSVVVLQRNAGKGAAVYAGWRKSQGETWLGFVDCDGAVAPEEVLRLAEIASQAPNTTAVIGSRVGAAEKTVKRRWHRRVLGRCFVFAVNHLLGFPVQDSQCGLKWISATAFQVAAPQLREKRFAFDVDLLLALRLGGATLREEPVSWRDARHSSMRLWIDGPAMLAALVRLCWRYRIMRPSRPAVVSNGA